MENHSLAKKLVVIPIILAVIPLLSLVVATVLEGPTHRGTVYTVFMIIVILGLFLAPPASMILSLIAIILSIKALTKGSTRSPGVLIIGIIEFTLSIGGIILAIMFVVAGKGV